MKDFSEFKAQIEESKRKYMLPEFSKDSKMNEDLTEMYRILHEDLMETLEAYNNWLIKKIEQKTN